MERDIAAVEVVSAVVVARGVEIDGGRTRGEVVALRIMVGLEKVLAVAVVVATTGLVGAARQIICHRRPVFRRIRAQEG